VGLLVLFEPQKHGFRAARAAIALPESRGGPLGDRMTTCNMAAFVQPCAWSYPQFHGKGSCGCLDITAGTAATTSGRRAAGIDHHMSMHGGLRRAGCIVGMGTCSLKDTGA